MLKALLSPVASYIFSQEEEAAKELFRSSLDNKSKRLKINDQFLFDIRHVAEEIHVNGLVINPFFIIHENLIKLNQCVFPLSLQINFENDIKKGNLRASKLIDIETIKNRKITHYKVFQEEKVALFQLEETKNRKHILIEKKSHDSKN